MSKPVIHKDNVSGASIKSIDDQTGMIEGWASVYNVKDSDDEYVDKNCFQRSLSHNGGKVPILFGHDRNQVAGWAHSGMESDRGLFVTGKLALETEIGKKAYYFLKGAMEAGANDYATLSIGFVPDKNGVYKDDSGNIHYRSAALKEWSVVPFASNPEATITSVKQCAEYTEANPELTNPTNGELPMLLPNITVEQAIKAAKGEDAGLNDEQKQGFSALKMLLGEIVKQDFGAAPAVKDDGSMDDGGSDAGPTSFEEAMSNHAKEQQMSDKRYQIEKARQDSMDSILSCRATKGSKKTLIHKALHAHADALSDWYGDKLDQSGAPSPAQKGAAVNAPVHAAMLTQLAKAKVHMEEKKSAMQAVNYHDKKSHGYMNTVVSGYAANDLNLPNPTGKSASNAEANQEEIQKAQEPVSQDWSCVYDAIASFDQENKE